MHRSLTRRIWPDLAAMVLAAILGVPALADTLHLRGVLVDEQGRPRAGESFRLVLGSDRDPRAQAAGRQITTDSRGRFALTAEVSLPQRRIRLDSVFARHDSRLLELGFGFDLVGRPALYWVEVDFTRHGPLRGIEAFVAGQAGRFDQRLIFHDREHAWSFPDDPRRMRLSGIGADLRVDDARDGSASGVWHLDVTLTKMSFQMR